MRASRRGLVESTGAFNSQVNACIGTQQKLKEKKKEYKVDKVLAIILLLNEPVPPNDKDER